MATTVASKTPISVRDSEWTPRQREVLDLLVRRFTNAQIASTLQISLDGAKWHVSEIITKLGVDSRDEAADYWRSRNGMQARLFRAVRAMAPGATWGRWLAGAAGTGVAVGFAAAIVLAWPSDDSAPATNADLPSTRTSVPAPGGNGQTVLSNGSSGYSYTPALAYVAPGGQARVVDRTGAQVATLMSGCDGLGSAKQGDVINGGLRWSADGSNAYCLTDSLSVKAAAADGSNPATLFNANGCPFILDIVIAPSGDFAICQAASNSTLTIVGANGRVEIPSEGPRFAVSPSGTAIIVPGPVVYESESSSGVVIGGPDRANNSKTPGVGHGSWRVYAPDGSLLGSIEDAYVAEGENFAWTLDGSAFAYPGEKGLAIVGISNGWSVTTYPLAEPGRGPAVTWVLDDKALLVHGNESVLLRRDGTQVALPSDVAYETAGVAPDGRHVVAARYLDASTTTELVVIDLTTNSVRAIPGSQERVPGISFGPAMTFAGDSGRVCWLMAPNTNASAKCADLNGSAFTVNAPYQVEPDVLGYGDYSVLWRAFSPDLQHVAYTTPGLADRNAKQTLWIADLDGSNAVKVGEAQGVLPYEWQPDGVYRPNSTGY